MITKEEQMDRDDIVKWIGKVDEKLTYIPKMAARVQEIWDWKQRVSGAIMFVAGLGTLITIAGLLKTYVL